MNNKITEEWVTEVLSRLFGLFDEKDIRNLGVPGIESCDNPVEYVANFYAHRTYAIIGDQMDLIPVDTAIDIETGKRKLSDEKVSRVRGYLLAYTPMKVSQGFGAREMNELWILEDGRLAEVTSVCFIQDNIFNNHRKFRNIVKRKKDIWFKPQVLEPAFYLLALTQMGYPGLK